MNGICYEVQTQKLSLLPYIIRSKLVCFEHWAPGQPPGAVVEWGSGGVCEWDSGGGWEWGSGGGWEWGVIQRLSEKVSAYYPQLGLEQFCIAPYCTG